MIRTFHERRWRRLKIVGVALHLVFLLTSPFEHHDFLCHLKTPLHCTACSSSPVSSNPHQPDVLAFTRLADAGQAVPLLVDAHTTILAIHSTGRSPPVSA